MGPDAPTIGRIVHYYENDKQEKPWAAFVIDVHNDTLINVAGFNTWGTQFSKSSVVESNDPTPGPRWCWPPRV